MKIPDPDFERRNPVTRGVLSVLALVVAVVLGLGLVVLVSHAVGPTHSDSAAGTPAKVARPTVSLPANATPSPVLLALDPNAPAPTPEVLAAAMAPALASPLLPDLTASVLDPATGTMLFDQGGADPQIPGSTMKLYIAAAAAITFEPGHRFTTSVTAGSVPGEIVLVAGGDPTLSSQPESAFYPGAATVAQLAAAVQAAGVTGVTRVVVDNAVFGGAPVRATGWGSGDAPSTYAAEVYPVMVDGGRSGAAENSVRHADPDLVAGQALAAALGTPAAEVVRGPGVAGAAPIASVQSAPVESLIEQMVLISDNTLAECLGRLVAIANGQPPTFEGAVAAVNAVLVNAGVDLTGVTAYDVSGLSVQDRTTTASLTSLLSAVVNGNHPRLDVVASALAVGGYSGTLATRYAGDDASAGAAGQVRGKTGTLTGVTSLAGTVLTADGRLLIYAFIANGTGAPDPARAALDDIAAAIAACGCR